MKNLKISCNLCNSQNIKINVAGTVFCFECNYCETKSGKVYRLIDHPLFETCGYRIRKWDADFGVLK